MHSLKNEVLIELVKISKTIGLKLGTDKEAVAKCGLSGGEGVGVGTRSSETPARYTLPHYTPSQGSGSKRLHRG